MRALLCLFTVYFLLSPESIAATLPLEARAFVDSSAAMTAEEVVQKADALAWAPVREERASFGQTHARVWLRFRFPEEKLKQGNLLPLYLEIPTGFVGRLHLYSVTDGKVRSVGESGFEVPLSKRGPSVLPTGFTVFRMPPPRDPGSEYFLSAESSLPLSVPLSLREAPDFARHNWIMMFLVGVYAGCLAIAVVSNAFLAVSLRSRLYATYAFFVLFMLLIFLFATGVSVQLFWPESTWWAEREMVVYSGFALYFYASFVRQFLNTKSLWPLLDRLILIGVALSSLRSVWLLFQENHAVALTGELASALCNFLVLVIAVKALRSGDRAARYFFLSSLVFNLAMVVFLLQEVNLIWIGVLGTWAPFAGTLIEVNLLALALADRIRRTNRELAQQKAAVVHADKMGALGRMAGEIAHEISNPLAVIHGNAVMMRTVAESGAPSPATIHQLAQTIESTANRISKVVKGMRSLARDSRVDPLQSCAVSAILQDAVSLCNDRIRAAGARVEIVPFTDDLAFQCRSSEICQVLVNLIGNSLDAMEGLPDPWIKVELRSNGKMLELAISDNGPGIPKNIRSRILEPFFTTKEVGKGLGLGLSISHSIIQEGHGGKLWLDETSERTRFVISLPSSG